MYNSGGTFDPQYQAAYQRAERRVKAKLGFYWHLASYVIVNGLLIAIYLLTGPIPGFYSYPWFVWPMFGWGIGLLFHFLGVFVFSGHNNEDARRRMIEEEMRRMGAYNPGSTGSEYPGAPGGYPGYPPPPGTGTPPSNQYQVPPDRQP
jgi:hypothetical protein